MLGQSRPQTTDNRQQTTDNRPQTTDNKQQTTDRIPKQPFLRIVCIVFIYGPFGSRTFFLEVAKIVGIYGYYKSNPELST